MYEDNPDAKIVELMAPYHNDYWAIHQPWAEAYNDLLTGWGKDEALEKQISDLGRRSVSIIKRVKKALAGRPMYPGSR